MSLDYAILHLLSSRSHTSWTLDMTMLTLANNEYLKGVVVVLFWWVWFRAAPRDDRAHRILVATLPAPFVAFFAGRLFANVLPFRVRPFANPALHWRFAEGFDPQMGLRRWSSFPSDHAACFAAVVFPILLISVRLGVLGFLYTFLVIDLPRVYLGLHYPTDILGGILVGCAVSGLLATPAVRNRIAPPFLRTLQHRPKVFYAGVFLCLFTVSSINSIHDLTTTSLESFRAWHHHLQGKVDHSGTHERGTVAALAPARSSLRGGSGTVH